MSGDNRGGRTTRTSKTARETSVFKDLEEANPYLKELRRRKAEEDKAKKMAPPIKDDPQQGTSGLPPSPPREAPQQLQFQPITDVPEEELQAMRENALTRRRDLGCKINSLSIFEQHLQDRNVRKTINHAVSLRQKIRDVASSREKWTRHTLSFPFTNPKTWMH